MQARSGSRLLVILFFVLAAPLTMRCQTNLTQADLTQIDRGERNAGDSPILWSPRLPPPYFPGPGRGPVGIYPRRFPVPPVRIGLPQITRAAGTIFSGSVTAIASVSAFGSQVDAVSISFHVDRAIRGVIPGQTLTIFQWIGLWQGGQRYRVGEHVVLFLYPPSKLGLTSCVGGPLGRFSIDSLNQIALSEQHMAAFGADPALGGKSRIRFRDFIRAARRPIEEE
jgi:hypothetical protein